MTLTTEVGLPVELLSREWASWEELLRRCGLVAQNSPDPSTQNGAVLVVSDGNGGYPFPATYACNRFPVGVRSTPDRWERPLKYQCVLHAEQNALSMAGLYGILTRGTTLVCPWAACDRCAVSIIAGGVTRVVTLRRVEDETNARWNSSCDIADVMFEEAGVELLLLDPPKDFPPLLRGGVLIEKWD